MTHDEARAGWLRVATPWWLSYASLPPTRPTVLLVMRPAAVYIASGLDGTMPLRRGYSPAPSSRS